jgi:hypothetical protein
MYAYVDSSPTNLVDPSGLKKSKEECAQLLADLLRKVAGMGKDLLKYDPVLDGQGGPNWKRGGHYEEIMNWQRGIRNDLGTYLSQCNDDGNGPVPPCALDAAHQKVQPPVFAPQPGVPTQFELDQLAEAANDRVRYYEIWLKGDLYLAGAVAGLATAPALGPLRVLIHVFAH